MAKIKLTKTVVESTKPQAQAVELRDTLVPGFLCKITSTGRWVFMLQYRTNTGERRKPALGQFGELTVEQARIMAQAWLAEVSQLQLNRIAKLLNGRPRKTLNWKTPEEVMTEEIKKFSDCCT